MSKYNVSAQGENCSCLYARKKLIHRLKLKYRICTNFISVSTIFVKKIICIIFAYFQLLIILGFKKMFIIFLI